MKREDLAPHYQAFFLKNEGGKHFVKTMQDTLTQLHMLSENDPANAASFSQRAKGVRLILEHIDSVLVPPKKTTNPEEGKSD